MVRTRQVVAEPAATLPSEVRAWAGQLASENRDMVSVVGYYVPPRAFSEIQRQLENMSGVIIGLVGLQGVGKSSALRVLQIFNTIKQGDLYKKQHKQSLPPHLYETAFFKWRRQPQLLTSLLNGTHELSGSFLRLYKSKLVELTKPRIQFLNPSVIDNPQTLNPDWAERQLSKKNVENLREITWFELLRSKKTILIDTPDYSKTDRRLMARDLEELYWLWDILSQWETRDNKGKPNIVVAIQKEMFGGHFFLDKIVRIDVEPLRPEQLVEAYKCRFKAADPFTDEALLTLARMSRGVFRRFLRYITLTLDLWETKRNTGLIVQDVVKEAVPAERLADDMELELLGLFPKHSDLRNFAVQLLQDLEERGPRKQSELAAQLRVEGYALSRLLAKLEAAKYIIRTRDGLDKHVRLRESQTRGT